ncbi:hypothetical protein PsYK624_122460 [Phanerochaete sordida]|uniref:Uncharacterized protein n=1 Tax=Phanerochaete sordida TaxID=48140 RepID=A0A9P3GJG0_9APHY|nr:hypothetical protein PsYK624_122460 [Phanerochaete sordida]
MHVHRSSTGLFYHPEVFMDWIHENDQVPRWNSHVIRRLDGMTKDFDNPFIIFYPTRSKDGMPFPVNVCVSTSQKSKMPETIHKKKRWRGDIVVAKLKGSSSMAMGDMMGTSSMETEDTKGTSYTELENMRISDYPLVLNWLMRHSPLDCE